MSFRQDHFFNMFRNRIMKELYEAEGNLPRDDLFKDYRHYFSYYVMSMQRFFNNKNEYNTEFIEHLFDTVKITDEVWDTFGEGERILEHDNYLPYIQSVESWKRKYYSHLKSLKIKLNEFNSHIVDVVGAKNLKRNYSDSEKEFLKSVLSTGSKDE